MIPLLTPILVLISYTYEFQTIGNPNLVSDILISGDSLLLATSAGILILNRTTLEEIDRIDKLDGLHYPVVLKLVKGDTGIIWGVLWKHGIFVWDTHSARFIKHRPPDYLPTFENTVDLIIRGDTLVFITPSALVAYNLNGTPLNPLDDTQLLYLQSLGGANKFFALFLYEDTLYVGTDQGLYIASWANIDSGTLYTQGLPSDTVLYITKDENGTFVGTAKGVYVIESSQCYFCTLNKKVKTMEVIGDILYVDLYENHYLMAKNLVTGEEWQVALPDTVKDIRKIISVDNRILLGLGGDDMNNDYEKYNYGFGLGIIEADSVRVIRFNGPYFQGINILRYDNGVLWVLGVHDQQIKKFKVRTSYLRDGNWYPIADSGRTKGANYLDIHKKNPWLNNFLGSSDDSVGIFILDSVGSVIREVMPPVSQPRLVMSFVFDQDQNAVLAYWFVGLGIYSIDGDSFIPTPVLETEPFSLFIDHRNWLWMGTGSGLEVFNYIALRDSMKVVHPVPPPSGTIGLSTVTSFADDGNNVWIGTWNGLGIFDGTQFRELNQIPYAVFDIDTAGSSVFVLTENGLYILNQNGIILDSLTLDNSPLPDKPGIEFGNFYLYQERNGLVVLPDSQLIFIGTSKGILRVKTDRSLFYPQTEQELKIVVYPNPVPGTYDSIRITNLSGYSTLSIFTIEGVRITGIAVEQRPFGFVVKGVREIPPGLYFGVAKSSESSRTFKFAKLK